MLNSEQLSCLTGPNLINDAQISSEEDESPIPDLKMEQKSQKEETKQTNLSQKVSDLISEFQTQQPSFNQDFINYISPESLQLVGTVVKQHGDKYLLQADVDSLKKVGILDLNNFVFVLSNNIPALLGFVSDVLGQVQNPLYQIQRHTSSNVEVEENNQVYISMLKIKTVSMQEILIHKGRDYELDQHGNVVTAQFESDQQLTKLKQPEKKKKKKTKKQKTDWKPVTSKIDNYAQIQSHQPVPAFNQPYGFNPQYQVPQVPFTAYAPSSYHIMSTPSLYPNHVFPHPAQIPNPSLPPSSTQIPYPYQSNSFWPYQPKKE